MIRFLLCAILLSLSLSGCGRRVMLEPVKGQSLPVKPEGAAKVPNADELLKPEEQSRPQRSDELLRKSEKRQDDKFDLPPSR
jgi:hypothetical protein